MALRKPFLEAAGECSPGNIMAFKAVEGTPSLTSSEAAKGQSTEALSGKGRASHLLCSPAESHCMSHSVPFAARGAATALLYEHKGQVGDPVVISGLGLVLSEAGVGV